VIEPFLEKKGPGYIPAFQIAADKINLFFGQTGHDY
jgi:hypothetical protein